MTTPDRDPVVTVPAPPPDEFKDLGFGAEVARSARRRLLNHDGSFNVVRKGLSPFTSLRLYHWALTTSWPKFLGVVSVLFLLLNIITFATLGDGNIVRAGIPARLVVAVLSLAYILSVALAGAMVFARIARPTARIIYSRNALVAPYRGGTALEFRIANERSSQIIEAEVQVIFTRMEKVGSAVARRFYELPLERSRVVFFTLAWTVVHPIDGQSPLNGLTARDLADADAEVLVLFTGIDEAFSQTMHSRSSYKFDEIVWGAKFANMFLRTEAEGVIGMNMERIHEIEMVYRF